MCLWVDPSLSWGDESVEFGSEGIEPGSQSKLGNNAVDVPDAESVLVVEVVDEFVEGELVDSGIRGDLRREGGGIQKNGLLRWASGESRVDGNDGELEEGIDCIWVELSSNHNKVSDHQCGVGSL